MTAPLSTQMMEVPREEFVDRLSFLVQQALQKNEWIFSCEDMELTTEEFASKDGMLPLVLWVSGQTLEKIWGPQELMFRCDSTALCGVVADLRRPVLPASVWMHAVHFELERAVAAFPNGPAVVDEWFAQWNAALRAKRILLLSPSMVPTVNHGG